MTTLNPPITGIAAYQILSGYDNADGLVIECFTAGGASLGKRLLPGVTDSSGVAAALASNLDVAPPPKTIAELRDELRVEVANQRWRIETGGIKITSLGIAVATDDRSKGLIAAAAARARANSAPTCLWKCADGSWRTLTAAQIIAMDAAVAGHIAGCFQHEAALQAAITAAPDAAALNTIKTAITTFAPAGAEDSTPLPRRRRGE